jgi:hypothetical protein
MSSILVGLDLVAIFIIIATCKFLELPSQSYCTQSICESLISFVDLNLLFNLSNL